MSETPIPEGRYLDAGGLRLHYHDEGSGEPILFFHGSGPGASGYSNFKGNYPVLADAGYRCIVPDLPGYGLSDKPADIAYINDFFVDTMADFASELDLGGLTLLGNSLGGAIALGFALAHPQRVKRLILMAPGGVEEREAYFEMEGIQRMMALFAEGPLTEDSMRRLLSLQLYDPGQIDDDTVRERVAVCADQPREVLSTMRVPNYTDRLGEIRSPTIGFWGINDAFNPLTGAEKIAAGIPDAKVTLVNRCGHWVMVEHRDWFNRQCLDFLEHS